MRGRSEQAKRSLLQEARAGRDGKGKFVGCCTQESLRSGGKIKFEGMHYRRDIGRHQEQGKAAGEATRGVKYCIYSGHRKAASGDGGIANGSDD